MYTCTTHKLAYYTMLILHFYSHITHTYMCYRYFHTIILTYTYTCVYRHYLESQLAVAWGGRVAEELVFGQSKVRIMTQYHILSIYYILNIALMYT